MKSPHTATARHAMRTLAIAVLLTPAACTADTATAPSTAPGAHAGDPPAMHFDTTTMNIKGKEFTIELAITEDQEQRGLMYRDSMPDDHGMLFVFDKPKVQSFWMKNTRIPLDIVFLDSTGHLVVVEHAKAMDETPVGPNSATQFVIELNAGVADKLGLKVGDKIDVPAKYLKN